VHQFPVGTRHPAELDRAERLPVEFDRLGRPGTNQMRRNRMHPTRDRFQRTVAIFFLVWFHGYSFSWFEFRRRMLGI
jgi:hypothetical protein